MHGNKITKLRAYFYAKKRKQIGCNIYKAIVEVDKAYTLLRLGNWQSKENNNTPEQIKLNQWASKKLYD